MSTVLILQVDDDRAARLLGLLVVIFKFDFFIFLDLKKNIYFFLKKDTVPDRAARILGLLISMVTSMMMMIIMVMVMMMMVVMMVMMMMVMMMIKS